MSRISGPPGSGGDDVTDSGAARPRGDALWSAAGSPRTDLLGGARLTISVPGGCSKCTRRPGTEPRCPRSPRLQLRPSSIRGRVRCPSHSPRPRRSRVRSSPARARRAEHGRGGAGRDRRWPRMTRSPLVKSDRRRGTTLRQARSGGSGRDKHRTAQGGRRPGENTIARHAEWTCRSGAPSPVRVEPGGWIGFNEPRISRGWAARAARCGIDQRFVVVGHLSPRKRCSGRW